MIGHQKVVSRTGMSRVALKVDCRLSRIGKIPVTIPKGVQVKLDGNSIVAKGPLGEMKHTLVPQVTIEQVDSTLKITPIDESRECRAMHGLSRSLVANIVNGVSTGFEKKLEMVGTGYRASVAGAELTLNVGYSKPRILAIPEGLKVTVEKNTAIKISGYDKVQLGLFCAEIRRQRPPEPYKGKGIKNAGEVIKLKEGKGAGGKKK